MLRKYKSEILQNSDCLLFLLQILIINISVIMHALQTQS